MGSPASSSPTETTSFTQPSIDVSLFFGEYPYFQQICEELAITAPEVFNLRAVQEAIFHMFSCNTRAYRVPQEPLCPITLMDARRAFERIQHTKQGFYRCTEKEKESVFVPLEPFVMQAFGAIYNLTSPLACMIHDRLFPTDDAVPDSPAWSLMRAFTRMMNTSNEAALVRSVQC
jgi:hypothetical protein